MGYKAQQFGNITLMVPQSPNSWVNEQHCRPVGELLSCIEQHCPSRMKSDVAKTLARLQTVEWAPGHWKAVCDVLPLPLITGVRDTKPSKEWDLILSKVGHWIHGYSFGEEDHGGRVKLLDHVLNRTDNQILIDFCTAVLNYRLADGFHFWLSISDRSEPTIGTMCNKLLECFYLYL